MSLKCMFALGAFLFSNWAVATVSIKFPAFTATVVLETPIPIKYNVDKVRVEGSVLPPGNEIDFVVNVDEFGRFNIPEFQMSCPNIGRCNRISVKLSFLNGNDRSLSSISREYETQTDVSNFYRWHFDQTVLQLLPETRIQYAAPGGNTYLSFWDYLQKIVRGSKYENLDNYEWAIYSEAHRVLRHQDRNLHFSGGQISKKVDCPNYPELTNGRACILFNNSEEAKKAIYAEAVLFEGNRIWTRRPVDLWDIDHLGIGELHLVIFDKGTSRPRAKFVLNVGRNWNSPGKRTVFLEKTYDSSGIVRGRMIEY